MNAKMLIGLSLVALTSFGIVNSASAGEKTRAEVRAELIQAENNGSRFVTEASYPEVSPIYAQQVAQLQQRNGSVGGAVMGTSQSGRTTGAPAACVGPNSFCNLYAGS
jgi:uridylate kinase